MPMLYLFPEGEHSSASGVGYDALITTLLSDDDVLQGLQSPVQPRNSHGQVIW